MAKKSGGINYGEFEWSPKAAEMHPERAVIINGQRGILYNPEGDYAKPEEVKGYEKWSSKFKTSVGKTITAPPKPAPTVKSTSEIINERATKTPKEIKGYAKQFPKNTPFRSANNKIAPWAKPLTAKGGKNPNYNWERVKYVDTKTDKIKNVSSKERWGTDISGALNATILQGTKEWIKQIQIAIHKVDIMASNYKVVALNRALKVFQQSFKYQKFYSQNSSPWHPLAPLTLHKRGLLNQGTQILKTSGEEGGQLEKSLVIEGDSITTKPVKVYKRYPLTRNGELKPNFKSGGKISVVYAGFHNEGKENNRATAHHGIFSTLYHRRQFMGHSTYLDPLSDPFMARMMKLYLFDSVFMAKK